MKMLLSSDTKRNVQNIPHCVTFGQILLLERQNTLAEQQGYFSGFALAFR